MYPSFKVLVLTAHEDRGYLLQLLEAGASGYVLTRAAAEELVHAIRTIAGGGFYVDPSLAGKVIASAVRKPSATDALIGLDLRGRGRAIHRRRLQQQGNCGPALPEH